METPLLNGAVKEDYEAVRSLKEAKTVFLAETVKVWRIGGPIVFNMLCQYGMNSITNIFVGHIGEIQLSAVAVSLTVTGTFSLGLLLGMGSALETLCGQAFGAGKVHMLGVYMQRSWIISLVTCIILSPIYIFAAPLLKLFGEPADLADLAGSFTILTLPQFFSLAIEFPTAKFLQAQGKVNALAVIGFVALFVHILMLYLFIFAFGWGITGAAIAYDISGWGIAIAQVTYVTVWCNDGWHGLSWSAFSDIWAFVRLSVASGVMLCLEVWYMTSIILLVGHLDNAVVAVGSLSICMNLNGWESILFVGVSVGVSVRVSNELGLGRPRAAKYAIYSTLFQSLLIGLCFMVIVLITKNHFAIIFTNSKVLQLAVAKLAYLLGITMVLNSVQPVISGVAVGGGWQALVAYINVGCYYLFGIPVGYLLGYTAGFGVKGLWAGMICGTALQTLMLIVVLYRTNWSKEVEESAERIRKWGGREINPEMITDTI